MFINTSMLQSWSRISSGYSVPAGRIGSPGFAAKIEDSADAVNCW